ncbi:MAG: EpsG family protein [Ruminococcus sp.]
MSFITDCYAWCIPLFAILEVALINKKRDYLSNTVRIDSEYNYDKSYDYRVTLPFAIIVFLPLILIAGFRAGYVNSIGDTGLYVTMFDGYPNTLNEIGGSISPDDKMYGWAVFSVFIKQFISSDYQIWLLIIAVISGFSLLYGYKNYTSEVVFCAFMFFISTDFFSWMTNGMRQFMVVAIIFASANLLLTRKIQNIILFILIVILLSNIHSSCLLVIPLYIVSLGKPFNKRVLLVIFSCLLSVVFIGQFTSILDSALEFTTYNNVTTQMLSDDGTNPLRALLYSWPSFLAIYFRKKIPEDISPVIAFSINASLISMGIYIISIFTSGIFIGRIPIFFSLFNYVLIPWELKTFFEPKTRQTIYYVIVAVYFVYFVYQTYSWGMF